VQLIYHLHNESDHDLLHPPVKEQGMPSNAKILVTGAPGGTQGATARLIVEELTRRGVAVAAMVQRTDERSAALQKMGAEIEVGNLLSLNDVLRATRGRDAIYFCFPVRPGLLEASSIMAHAAKEAGAKFVVNLSQGSATSWSPSPTGRKHWLSERIFAASKVPTFSIRGGVFYENLFRQFKTGLESNSELRAPFRDGSSYVPVVSAKDISLAATLALLQPGAYAGKTRFVVSEVLSIHEMAGVYSEWLSRPVHYKEVSSAAWLAEAADREDSQNIEQLQHLVSLWEHLLKSNDAGALPVLRSILSVRNAIYPHRYMKLGQWLRDTAATSELVRIGA
jgi:NAD(P)H dehydrogenase (quinone)